MKSGLFSGHPSLLVVGFGIFLRVFVTVEGLVEGGCVRLDDDAVAPVGLNCRIFAGMQLTCSSSCMLAANPPMDTLSSVGLMRGQSGHPNPSSKHPSSSSSWMKAPPLIGRSGYGEVWHRPVTFLTQHLFCPVAVRMQKYPGYPVCTLMSVSRARKRNIQIPVQIFQFHMNLLTGKFTYSFNFTEIF